MIGDDVGPATYREIFAVGAFRVLFGSYVLLLVGDTVRMLALAVLVYERTGSPALSALAYVAGFVPQAFGGALLLSLTDRLPVRAAMVGYDLIRCVMALVLAVDVLPVWAVLVLLASVGLVSPVAGAARQRTLPELLHGDAYVLGRSVFGVTAGAMQVLGYAVGGVLLALVGPGGALVFAGAVALVSALVVRFGLARGTAAQGGGAEANAAGEAGGGAESRARPEGTIRATWRVNRELLGDPVVRGLLLAQWVPANLAVAAEGVIVPYAPDSAGLLYGSTAAGMLLGNLLVGRFVRPIRRERLVPWLALQLGVPLLLVAASPPVGVTAALFVLSGAGFAYQLGLQRRFLAAVPKAGTGQAMGLAMTGTMTLQGASMAGAGALAGVVDPGHVIALSGVAAVIGTAMVWRMLRPGDVPVAKAAVV
ncbi:MFS transporter [Embleya scabrispora]|uniref:MFS transporter n=1 Tax=Embleya scabrispora TaxID=159449 RepID=A0A1T3NQN8_9ACTN|nr:MFS transporter [Embleya scabrispora]OPC79055.1 MFS transporter [Embleya scabrispora]